MNPLIANNIVRYTVNGTYAGRTVANVLDFEVAQVGSAVERAAACATQAGVIVSAWAEEITERLVDEYVATSVSWLDLDSLTGSTGLTTVGPGLDMPKAGEDIGAAMPGNVALRPLKNITPTRGQRQGRMYLVGVAEAETAAASPNQISSGGVTAWNTKLTAFLTAVNVGASVTPPSYTARLCVVHTHVDKVDPDDPDTWVLVYEGRSLVNSLTMDQTLASQRRRLRA